MHFTTFRNLGKSGLRVSCLGLGESGRTMQILYYYSLNFCFESLISLSNVNVKNVNSAACLIIVCFVVGTWVTFGSQITDKVGRKECTCNITLLSEAKLQGTSEKKMLDAAIISMRDGFGSAVS